MATINKMNKLFLKASNELRMSFSHRDICICFVSYRGRKMAELEAKDTEECLYTDMLAKSISYEMTKKFRTVRVSHCQGCRFNLLSQNDHDLCLINLYDQVCELFDVMILEIDDSNIWDNFELLVFAQNGVKMKDVPYHFTNKSWRSGLLNNRFDPGMKKRIIFFLTLDHLQDY